MKEERCNDTRTKGNSVKIEDILKTFFSVVGIECKSVTFCRQEAVDDEIITVPISSLASLVKEFVDGSYHIGVETVVISGVSESPIEIPWLCIEISYRGSTWSEPRIFADEETIDEKTIAEGEDFSQILFGRLETIKGKLRSVLQLTAIFARVAQGVSELFS